MLEAHEPVNRITLYLHYRRAIVKRQWRTDGDEDQAVISLFINSIMAEAWLNHSSYSMIVV